MKKYLVEFIGTFLFVLVVGMVVIGHDPNNFMLPVAIGSTLMVMVYAGGHVSGGHYNPAVTLAVWLRGRCATAEVPIYWLSQILGAFAASFVVMYLKGNTTATTVEAGLPCRALRAIWVQAAPRLSSSVVALCCACFCASGSVALMFTTSQSSGKL